MVRSVVCALIVASSVFAGCSASPESKAKANVAKHLAKRLNDPDSYKPADWGALTAVSGCPNVKHYIQHEYRAKNKLGGYVTTTDIFLLKDDLNVYLEMSEDSLSTIRQSRRFADASLEEIIRDFADKPKE